MHRNIPRARPLMRGGLARQHDAALQPLAPLAPVHAGAPPAPTGRLRVLNGGLAEVWADLTRGVEWSPVFIGFLGYIFAITTYAIPIGDVAMGFAVFMVLFQREKFIVPPLALWLLVFVAWCGIGMVQSSDQAAVWEKVYLMIKLLVIVVVAANAIRTPAQLRFLVVFWLACYAFFPVRGAYFNYYLYNNTRAGRALWRNAFDNPNDLAAMTLLQLSIAVALLGTERQRLLRLLAMGGVAMMTLLVFMTQSRGAILALGVFGMAYLAGSRRGQRMRSFLALGAVAGILAMFAPSSVWDRVGRLKNLGNTSNLREVDREGSAEQRLEIWKVAVAIIKQNPTFGVGLGLYPRNHNVMSRRGDFKETARGARDTHSTLLNVAAETGIPGVSIFSAMLLASLLAARQHYKRLATWAPSASTQLRALQLGFVAYLIAGIWGSLAKISFLYLHCVLLWVASRVYTETRGQRGSAA